MNILIVFFGAGIGGSLRYLVGNFATKVAGISAVWGTLFVNVLGSFLIGVLYTILLRDGADASAWQLFLITGLLGGFTTFSAFSADTIHLFQEGKLTIAIGYVVLSVTLSLAMFMLGDTLAKQFV